MVLLDSYLIQAKNEAGERTSAIIYDKKLGWVVYPSSKAVKDGIEKSMA
ncbi:MAG: hypothetical protein [Bacteriophage sp.]|nr:MAG: hypothetical protein [Bacteriophage sp.]